MRQRSTAAFAEARMFFAATQGDDSSQNGYGLCERNVFEKKFAKRGISRFGFASPYQISCLSLGFERVF